MAKLNNKQLESISKLESQKLQAKIEGKTDVVRRIQACIDRIKTMG